MSKKIGVILALFIMIVALQAQGPQQQNQMSAEDVQKALSLVDKPKPAPDNVKAGFEAISATETVAMLAYISSDWMKGRDTGDDGFLMAADYVISLFKSWGIKPGGDQPARSMNFRGMTQGGTPPAPPERSFLQEFALRQTANAEASLALEIRKGDMIKTQSYESGVDFMSMRSPAGTISAPVIFIGYGIQEKSIGWDELKNINIKDKIVLILSEAPGKDNPESVFQKNEELKAKYFPAGGGQMRGRGGPGRFNKTTELAKLGPAAILQVTNSGSDADVYRSLTTVRRPNDSRPIINRPRLSMSIPEATSSDSSSPVINITREIANAILENSGKTIDVLKAEIETTNKPASAALSGTRLTINSSSKTSLVRVSNVIGYIEGSDPTLKDEVFVVGAHFDHLGYWEDYIYNGADDNGSGSVGVMNIAKAMAVNPIKPKRTIVFCLWTGEEKGLLGSEYYVANPVFPMDKTIGYLNYDMISRAFDSETIARSIRQYTVPGTEELLKKIRYDQFATVNVTRDSGLYELTREMNEYVGLDLALREYDLGSGSSGSDHSSFAAVKKPFVYYMAAMTSDYHQPSDSVEKVSGEILTKISQIGYLTVFAVANK
ncbi:MAG: M20/M25/M40 family metallo-hydrolase [Candidatus Aminicenantes bacterium]|nr:M20/M25/M40 family metallo-hydrolase [Candidatus Aminicenantes bacterium]